MYIISAMYLLLTSEAKSVCIKRMQARLEIWDDELHRIAKTKKEDGELWPVSLG